MQEKRGKEPGFFVRQWPLKETEILVVEDLENDVMEALEIFLPKIDLEERVQDQVVETSFLSQDFKQGQP